MSTTIRPDREALARMAEALVSASGGRLRVARNEADCSTRRDREAATFLKLDGRRLGRDLEVYAFMAELQGGWEPVLPDLAVEIVLQLKGPVPEAYAAGAETLVAMGRSIYDAKACEQWAAIFEEAPVAPGPR